MPVHLKPRRRRNTKKPAWSMFITSQPWVSRNSAADRTLSMAALAPGLPLKATLKAVDGEEAMQIYRNGLVSSLTLPSRISSAVNSRGGRGCVIKAILHTPEEAESRQRADNNR
jgi:hypothetical protein